MSSVKERNRKNSSGSGMFLMEMMIVVCFFMLCASTCILAYAKADSLSRAAADRNQAVSAAQSILEVWKLSGTEGLSESFLTMPQKEQEQVHCEIIWDQDWNLIERKEAGCFVADVAVWQEAAGIENAKAVLYRFGDKAEELFTLETKRLIP